MRLWAAVLLSGSLWGCGDDATEKCLGCLRPYSKIAKTYSDCYALANSGTRPQDVIDRDEAKCDEAYSAAIIKGGSEFDACVVKYCEPPADEERSR